MDYSAFKIINRQELVNSLIFRYKPQIWERKYSFLKNKNQWKNWMYQNIIYRQTNYKIMAKKPQNKTKKKAGSKGKKKSPPKPKKTSKKPAKKAAKKPVKKAKKVAKKAAKSPKKASKKPVKKQVKPTPKKTPKPPKKAKEKPKAVPTPAPAPAPIPAPKAQLPKKGKGADKKNPAPEQALTPPPPIKKVVTIFKSESGGKKKPEPPGKYSFEYVINASPSHIFELVSSPSGLSDWFADDVNVRDGLFIFIWDGVPQRAKLVNYKIEKVVRFNWVDRNDDKYFEFRIEVDELTNEVSLFVTDFLEEKADLVSARLLWDKQISNLRRVLGS